MRPSAILPPFRFLRLIAPIALAWFGHGVGVDAGEIRYSTHIQPIFAEHCLHCHGPDAETLQGDLRLDMRSEAVQRAIVPHDSSQSELLARLLSDDPTLRMPPPESGKKLTPSQIELLRAWIDQGAEYEEHWSLRPIQYPPIPQTKTAVSTPIDHFVVSKLEQEGMQLSPPLEKRKWIRRATYDLLGLPPTDDEITTFLADDSPSAYASVLDRLLASPSYGQRWGRYWLDLARYADTHGGAAIGFRQFPFSYTYRDYVIDAFNRDLPYDRFLHEQIAADQLGLSESDPALAALGFLTVGMQYRSRHDVIDDQIDVVSRGLMGLTVACARCHDHKYDPIPTADYYALYATFAHSRVPEELPTIGPPATAEAFRQYQEELQRLQRSAQDTARDQITVMQSRLRMQVGGYLREIAKKTPEQDLSAAFLSYRTDDLRPWVLNRWREYLAAMPPEDPVFGPWVQLALLGESQFAQQAIAMLARMEAENGDPTRFAEPHSLGTVAPKWNPRVLSALREANANTLLEVADAYGKLFAETHRRWLHTILEATGEAESPENIVPDEDPRHAEINSAIFQQLRHHLYGEGTPTVIPPEIAATLLNRTIQDHFNGKRGAIENLHLQSPGSPPRAMILRESPQSGPFHLFRRGNPVDRGDIAKPGFLTVLSPEGSSGFTSQQRRIELAMRITATDNPLPRRVLVNWVWQHHFGQGLVRTADDFGVRGEAPTHPELLDYLATTFREDGWSIKALHRRIMLSDVYRQGGSEIPASLNRDPENRLLWRMPIRRLDLEAMRDAMLFVAQELDGSHGGRPFDLTSQGAVPRRTVYGFINRDIISSFSSTFDGPNPNACTAKRPETIVPQQTLYALNSDFIQDRSEAFARASREKNSETDDESRIRWMICRAFGREPRAEEIGSILAFLQGSLAERPPSGWPAERWSRVAHVLLAANEFIFVD